MESNKLNETLNSNKKNSSKHSKSFIVCMIIDILFVIFLFLTYGPISYFRNLLVTTAKGTWHHQYLAYIFYTESMVDKIMSSNYIINLEDDADTNLIIFDNNEITEYESIYEEQVLKREKDDLYKIIQISGTNYVGRIVVIYDPTRISFVQSKNIKYGGQIITDIVSDYNALIAINASGFDVTNNGLIPTGGVIIDSKIIKDSNGGNLIGFNKDGVMMLTHSSTSEAISNGMVYGMDFGPFLIVNGVSAITKGSSVGGIAPRTAIAQRKDGIVLFLTIDGRRAGYSLGATYGDLIDVFKKYGAYNAANLDGGGSSSMVVNGEMINVPGGSGYEGARYLPNAWIYK